MSFQLYHCERVHKNSLEEKNILVRLDFTEHVVSSCSQFHN